MGKNIIIVIVIFLLIFFGFGWYFYIHVLHYSVSIQPAKSITSEQNTSLKKDTFVIGETIDEDGLVADTKEFQPFMHYLSGKLKPQGIRDVQFVGTHSVQEMAELVREDKIDVVIDSAFPVYVVDNLAGGKALADRWKGGVETYHSAIFVKSDSQIKTLDDLKGKTLAFDSMTSTAGYFLPKAELIRQGYTMTRISNPSDPCSPTTICYVFVHGNVYDTVASGITPAGAESELEIDSHFGTAIQNYRIISRTPDILRFMVATRGDIDPALRSSLSNILFNMDKTPDGRTILHTFANTAKFTPVTDTDSAYGEIKNLTDLVELEIINQ